MRAGIAITEGRRTRGNQFAYWDGRQIIHSRPELEIHFVKSDRKGYNFMYRPRFGSLIPQCVGARSDYRSWAEK
jgi:hypothetical protein